MAILNFFEFFVTPDGFVYYKKPGEEAKRLTKFNTDIVDELHNVIKTRFPESYAALAKLYRRNTFKMVERFIRCNFGEHDLLTQDIEHDILHFEEVRCPLRGMCDEFDLTQDEVAERLGKNAHTVKVQLMRIKVKCGVSHCRDIIRVLRLNNY